MPFNVLSPDTAASAPETSLGAPLQSMGMTLNMLQGELDALLGRRADVETPRFTLWVNQAYSDICTSLDIDELKGSLGITLVPDQPAYRLPYQVSTIIGASMVLPRRENTKGGYPLDKMDLPTYRALEDADGDPRIFFRLGDLLVVWPTPDKARTIALDVRVRPLWLVENEDSPVLGLEWHEGILLSARQRGFSALMEYEKAASAGNEFVQFMRRRTDRSAKEQEGRVIGSAAPQRQKQIRNRVISHRPAGGET